MTPCWRAWKKVPPVNPKTLGLLGLGRRSGAVVCGEAPVQKACRGGQARLVAVSRDAGTHTVRNAHNWSKVPVYTLTWEKAELGHALGMRTCALLAVIDAGLAKAVEKSLAGEGNAAADARNEVIMEVDR